MFGAPRYLFCTVLRLSADAKKRFFFCVNQTSLLIEEDALIVVRPPRVSENTRPRFFRKVSRRINYFCTSAIFYG